jgi:hypothetical protein
MKTMMALGVLLAAAALPVFAQEAGGRRAFPLVEGTAYPEEGPEKLTFAVSGAGLRVSGRAGTGGAGYVIDAPEVLAFSGWDRLIIRVSGLTEGDSFDSFKMLKLELDDGAQATITEGMENFNDPAYINALEGEAVFDLSGLGDIHKINLVFFNCAVAGLEVEVFYE